MTLKPFLTSLFSIAILATSVNASDVINVVTDYGVVGDGVIDDTIALQNAINAGNTSRKKVIIPSNLIIKVTDTITIPVGTNMIEVLGAPSPIDVVKGSIVWHGGSGKPIIKILRQNSGLYSTLDGLSVVNIDPSTQTNVTGFLFRDEAATGHSFRVRGENLTVSNCETGFRWGNEEGGDPLSSTNIDENIYKNLKTYRCGVPFIFDTSASDNNLFEYLFFEGSYMDATGNGAYTCNQKIWLRKIGTNTIMRDVFVNAGDIAENGSIFKMNSGDGSFTNFNTEHQRESIKYFSIFVSTSRGNLIIDNWRSPTHTTAPAIRDTGEVNGEVSFGNNVLIQNCYLDGNVNFHSPVTAINNLFTDDGTTEFGFKKMTSDKDIIEIGTRYRTANNVISSNFVKNRIPLFDTVNKGFSIEMTNGITGDLSNNSFEDICEIKIPDNTAIGAEIKYFIYGPNVANPARLSERGSFIITATSDNSGQISSNRSKGHFSQTLDGFTSLETDLSITEDEINDTITLSFKQNNAQMNNSIRGIFKIEINHCITGGVSSTDPENLTFFSY